LHKSELLVLFGEKPFSILWALEKEGLSQKKQLLRLHDDIRSTHDRCDAYLKLYNDKDHHTNGNTNSQSGDVDNSVIPVTDQTSEGGFEIVFKHRFKL
jgi:hypothetical protein